MKQAAAWNEGAVAPCGEATGAGACREAARGRPRVKRVERSQMVLRVMDVAHLIEEDHPARAILEFVEKLDLSAYRAAIQAVEGVGGREPFDPQMLISLWIYGYSRGIGSARELARRCEYEPAFEWLTGLKTVNYHTLADFRVAHQEALDELFTGALAALSAEGLVSLERVMHDGTKVQACAGTGSFRREGRIQACLKAAREQVAAMGDPREDTTARQQAARKRFQRERVARLNHALEELAQIRQTKPDAESKAQVRASLTEPEARMMKQGNGGYAPCYNVQVSTEASNRVIVGVGLSQSASDYGELIGAMERVEENLGRLPEQAVVDGGYTSRENIVTMAEKKLDLIGSLDEHNAQSAGQMRRRGVEEAFYPKAFAHDAARDEFRCPAGKILRHEGQEKRAGVIQHQYRASWTDCSACAWKDRCCPGNETKGRSLRRAEESSAVRAFVEKMQTAAAKAIYRLRGPVAEFPNAWIKEKIGLRKFRVRGMQKARSECLWACLTYNIQQWIRLRCRVRAVAAVG